MGLRRGYSVMTSERRQMQALFAEDLSLGEIGRRVGVSRNTVVRHLIPTVGVSSGRLRAIGPYANALRLERLFTACNQALAAHSILAGHRP